MGVSEAIPTFAEAAASFISSVATVAAPRDLGVWKE